MSGCLSIIVYKIKEPRLETGAIICVRIPSRYRDIAIRVRLLTVRSVRQILRQINISSETIICVLERYSWRVFRVSHKTCSWNGKDKQYIQNIGRQVTEKIGKVV
jgi:hypothetical protein